MSLACARKVVLGNYGIKVCETYSYILPVLEKSYQGYFPEPELYNSIKLQLFVKPGVLLRGIKKSRCSVKWSLYGRCFVIMLAIEWDSTLCISHFLTLAVGEISNVLAKICRRGVEDNKGQKFFWFLLKMWLFGFWLLKMYSGQLEIHDA